MKHDDERSSTIKSSEDMLREEEDFLWPEGGPEFRAGLALSGGGVRSASVALGVLQTLANKDLLKRFHYLSTVSGGGFIGSALSWFWSQKRVDEEQHLALSCGKIVRFGAQCDDFPFQEVNEKPTEVGRQAVENLGFLRGHGSYLTSGDGIGFAGLAVALLRTVFLSLAVWVLVLILCFGAFEVLDYWIASLTVKKISANLNSGSEALKAAYEYRWSFRVLGLAVGAGVTIFLAGITVFSVLARFKLDSAVSSTKSRQRTTLAVVCGAMVIAIALIATIIVKQMDSSQAGIIVLFIFAFLFAVAFMMLAAAEVFDPANRSYFLRRLIERRAGVFLPIGVIFGFVSVFPQIGAFAARSAGELPESLLFLGPVGGVITLLSGVGTALYGYYLKAKSILPGLAGQAFAIAGSILFVAGLLLLTFIAAHEIAGVSNFLAGSTQDPALKVAIVVTSLVTALIIGGLGSVNAIGLHRFYRDRLMETFMPGRKSVEDGTALKSNVADALSLSDVIRSGEDRGNRPYHLINSHAILINDDDPKVALRGGDNFLLSPYFVGCSATGWVRTAEYELRYGPLSLATAMAVSGAATNANAGYIGSGLTRDRVVSAVMSILNIRLGLWVGNPKKVPQVTSKSLVQNQGGRPWFGAKVASFFHPLLTYGILGYGFHRDASFLELSDGGHFENLGLYELARRQLDLIVVVDAEHDTTTSLSALVSSTNRIREDFGIAARFCDGKGPEFFFGQDGDQYPAGVRFAKSPYIVVELRYPTGKRSVLIYLKSVMIKELEFATKGYKASNEDFPHQSTVDQFFDPDQFDAYRDLGKKICALMIREMNLEQNFEDVSSLLQQYGFSCTERSKFGSKNEHPAPTPRHR